VTALVCDTGLRTPSLALKLLRVIAVGCATVLPILMFLGRFVLDLSANMSDASRDFATLTFDLEDHSACR